MTDDDQIELSAVIDHERKENMRAFREGCRRIDRMVDRIADALIEDHERRHPEEDQEP